MIILKYHVLDIDVHLTLEVLTNIYTERQLDSSELVGLLATDHH